MRCTPIAPGKLALFCINFIRIQKVAIIVKHAKGSNGEGRPSKEPANAP